jgi:molybdopterin converting factor small subunit
MVDRAAHRGQAEAVTGPAVMIRIRVRVYGLLQAAVGDPDGWLEVAAPEGADIAGLVELLCDRQASPLFDARACMATIDGVKVPLSRTLQDGDQVHLYHTFGGG